MTRQFNQRIRCQSCGALTTEESPFERWMRNHPSLRSQNGIVRFDIDLLVHRYMGLEDGKSARLLQAMMFVEIKTFMATPSLAQRDTLHLLNQVLSNRKTNVHQQKPAWQCHAAPVKAFSLANQRDIRLRLFGGHLLQIDGTSPDNSSYMLWDKDYPLTESELVEVLLFERDPRNPTKHMDWRRRSKPFGNMPTLFPM